VIAILSGLVAITTLFGAMVLSAVALTGVTQPIVAYQGFAPSVFLLSLFTLVIGSAMYIIPEGLSEDGAWIMMTGGYTGTN
jgi:hypothetical protein